MKTNHSSVQGSLHSRLIDATVLLGFIFITCYMLRNLGWHALPAEDAIMLIRYSQHLAQGHGIVWNVGERPVDGATDFLFMVTIALISRLSHHGPILIARLLIAVSHLASVGLLYLCSRRLFGWPVWAAACLTLYLALDLAPAYVKMGFGAPFFAFMAMVAWALALLCIVNGATTARGIGLGFALLAMGLVRPEGVLLVGMILAAMLYERRREALAAVVPAVAVFASLGLVYFAWRWHYFGYPLPNPFYLKGGGHFFLDSLEISIENVLRMLAPALPFFVLSAFSTARRRAWTALIPTVGFTLIWVLLSNENNHAMRFQYGVVPLTLLSIPYITGGLEARFTWLRPGWISQTALVLLTIGLAKVYWKPMTTVTDGTGLYNIAVALQPYHDRDYVLAVTEAGLLPYFSEWRSVDLYGLNDPTIVHSKQGLTQEYLSERAPAIFLVLVNPDLLSWDCKLCRSVRASLEYVQTHNYTLAAVWGYNLCRRHYWYVRNGLPETKTFIDIVSRGPVFISDPDAAGEFQMIDLRGVPMPTESGCHYDFARLPLSQ